MRRSTPTTPSAPIHLSCSQYWTVSRPPARRRNRNAASRLEGRPQHPIHRGISMIDYHYWTTPNGHKVGIFLEESGLEYRITEVNLSEKKQFAEDFLRISP